MVEWHCLGSGPHLCGSITKAGPRNAALSFQGGFGFVVHRWHRVTFGGFGSIGIDQLIGV
jgi:hypothetical protein